MIQESNLELEKEKVKWEHRYVPVEDVILADNIRPIDEETVRELAGSIQETGQLQACIGDCIEIEGREYVRILAGQHRFHAICMINREGTPLDVLVRVANRDLDQEEILSIQMSENLHNKMTAAQDARVIHEFWGKMVAVYGRDKVTMEMLARKMARSATKVSESLRFVEGLAPKVQEMVDRGILSFSTALLLTNLDTESENTYGEQVRTAVFLVSKGYTTQQAKKHLDTLRAEKKFAGPLFGEEIWREMQRNGHLVSIKSEADKEGRSAAGWFVKMIRTIQMLDNPEKAVLSEGVLNALKELNMSLEEFLIRLNELNPREAAKLNRFMVPVTN